jgi:hypothetical protein
VRGQGAADADECVAATAVGDMDVVADAGAAGLPHGAAAHPPATALSDAHTSDSRSRVQPSESRIAFVKVHRSAHDVFEFEYSSCAPLFKLE